VDAILSATQTAEARATAAPVWPNVGESPPSRVRPVTGSSANLLFVQPFPAPGPVGGVGVPRT
jgi:hypothetical protein